MESLIQISVVIPIFNNQHSLKALTKGIIDHLFQNDMSCEILYVNDASFDRSLEILKQLTQEYQEVSYINLKKNIGQHKAILAGLQYAKGEKIVVLDGDLQDNPTYIKPLYDLLSGEIDAAFVLRKGIYQSYGRMITSTFMKVIIQMLIGLHYKAGSYFIIDRNLVRKLLVMECKYPYLTIMVMHGARGVEYHKTVRSRNYMPSSYTFIKRMKAAYQAIHCCLYCKYFCKNELY